MSLNQGRPIRQASAVPYRIRNDRVEFCLITSIEKRRWGFPKGIIDPGETPEETARKEAEEEAGLHGLIVGDPLGTYRYRKWGTELIVCVYLMQVTTADDEWEESRWRERVWCSADDARAIICRDEVRDLVDAAVERIASGRRGHEGESPQ